MIVVMQQATGRMTPEYEKNLTVQNMDDKHGMLFQVFKVPLTILPIQLLHLLNRRFMDLNGFFPANQEVAQVSAGGLNLNQRHPIGILINQQCRE
jgi:hypothetical protein